MTSYDAFLSYDPADEEWVENWLLPRLQNAGLKIATADDFALGRSRLVNIEHMLDDSRHTLCVLSPAWLKSEWSVFDALLSQTADPGGMIQRTIPLRRQPCELPRRIAMLAAADFTGPETRWERQFQRVLSALGSSTQPQAGTPPPSPSIVSSLPRIYPPLPIILPANDWASAEPGVAQLAVLQMIHNFERESPGTYVNDTQVADALQMELQDVRDYMDLLEAAGDAKSANSHDGHAAMLTARGRMRQNKLNVTIAAVQFIPESEDGAAVALKLQNRTERAVRISVSVYLQSGEELVPRRGGTRPTNPQTLAPETTTSVLVPLTIPRPWPKERPQVKDIKLQDGVNRTMRVPQDMIERLNDQIFNEWPFQEDDQSEH
jgi:hypothetical protein